jgi:hypothetical protein
MGVADSGPRAKRDLPSHARPSGSSSGVARFGEEPAVHVSRSDRGDVILVGFRRVNL